MKAEALEVLKNRRSVRKFKAEQVSEEALAAVLEAGVYAPTGAGTQGVKIVVVQDPEYLAQVKAMNARVMGKTGVDPYYGAPTVILVFATAASITPVQDGSAVTTNIVNAAYAAGLGSCWINRPKQMFESEEGKELLKKWGIEEELTGVASVALGYADGPQPEPKPRKADYVVRV